VLLLPRAATAVAAASFFYSPFFVVVRFIWPQSSRPLIKYTTSPLTSLFLTAPKAFP
jgi:hypothetical protein